MGSQVPCGFALRWCSKLICFSVLSWLNDPRPHSPLLIGGFTRGRKITLTPPLSQPFLNQHVPGTGSKAVVFWQWSFEKLSVILWLKQNPITEQFLCRHRASFLPLLLVWRAHLSFWIDSSSKMMTKGSGIPFCIQEANILLYFRS